MDPDDYKHSKPYKFLVKVEGKLENLSKKFNAFG